MKRQSVNAFVAAIMLFLQRPYGLKRKLALIGLPSPGPKVACSWRDRKVCSKKMAWMWN
jgi:hypothetical protein